MSIWHWPASTDNFHVIEPDAFTATDGRTIKFYSVVIVDQNGVPISRWDDDHMRDLDNLLYTLIAHLPNVLSETIITVKLFHPQQEPLVFKVEKEHLISISHGSSFFGSKIMVGMLIIEIRYTEEYDPRKMYRLWK